MDNRNVGRPLKFKSAEELKEKIGQYFKKMDAEKRPYSITGLALELDTSRETLLNYEQKQEFFDTIKRAKLRCENFAEEKLFTARNVTGAIFNLKNNYGWVDRQEVLNTPINYGKNHVTEDILDKEFMEFEEDQK